ncbi:MAG: portal protein [Akkermansiaceae bacterium]|jgi:hypothetical protein|nr:portal protein [Akkermansiaceae bacterium]
MEDATTILSRWGQMVGERANWDGTWQEVCDYALPRKGPITRKDTPGPGSNPANRLYDTTAIDAVSTLAAGHATAITPAGTQWFAWEAPDDVKSDEADGWYNAASEVTRRILSAGNFHTMLNEAFEDRAGFGICCISAFSHPQRVITFQAHPVGSFCIEEDADGNVDTIFLARHYTISQLAQKFGEKVIAGNDKLAASWRKFQEQGTNAEHEVVHAVFPRLKRKPKKLDAFNMPIASVWVAIDGPSVLLRSGFEEMPYMVSRYLKRSGGKQQYGYGPFEQVKAAILNANKSRQILQVVRQKLAVPPILTPDDLVGNVDLRPGGNTVFNSRSRHLPQEWLTNSNPQGLIDEINDDREAIRRAYHTDLFRMFADREKQMTAREVSELAAEKLMPFSPSFTRFTADFQIMMERIFAVLFRAGAFGAPRDIPRAVIRSANGMAEVPPPKVIYQSRIALAIRNFETAAADRLIERAIAVAQHAPEALDTINLDSHLRQSARNEGVSEEILRPERDVQKMRQARAEAAAQQAQIEQAQMAADAAGKLGIQAPPAA